MEHFDVVIVGGSYAGLAAAMALGRSLRKVLVIDSGLPCNRQTPYAHNFITHDGERPAVVAQKAKEQVMLYPSVQFINGLAVDARKEGDEFVVETATGSAFAAPKLLFATGVEDIMPDIPGFGECWGISVMHCPYCHGYEVRNKKLGLIANGDMAYEFVRLVHQWSKDIVLFTHGPAAIQSQHIKKFERHGIAVIETPVDAIVHDKGVLEKMVLKDGTSVALEGIFARPAFRQHCSLPEKLGCLLTQSGHLHIDDFGKTNISGVFAAGDNATMFRSLAVASAAGNKAGGGINKELAEERF